MRFTIRDLLWLMAVVAFAAMWLLTWLDAQRQHTEMARQNATLLREKQLAQVAYQERTVERDLIRSEADIANQERDALQKALRAQTPAAPPTAGGP